METTKTELFKPANLTEAILFLRNNCDRCIYNLAPNQCEILDRALLEKPTPEWHRGENGPACSNFKEGARYEDSPNFRVVQIQKEK